MKARLSLITSMALLATSALTTPGCLSDASESDAAYATEDADIRIYFADQRVAMGKILDTEKLGARTRFQTGYLYVDGQGFAVGEDEVPKDMKLIFEGELFPYAGGEPLRVLTVARPEYIPARYAATDGTLRVDFKDPHAIDTLGDSGGLGHVAGVFRGRVIATTRSTDTLTRYNVDEYLAPGPIGPVPPRNEIRDAEIFITPHAVLSDFTPVAANGSCFGREVVDQTVEWTNMDVGVALDGFPNDQPVTVEIRYYTPREVYDAHDGKWTWWEYLTDWTHWWAVWPGAEGHNVHIDTKTVTMQPGQKLTMEHYSTGSASEKILFEGKSHYRMYMEVVAYVDPDIGPFSVPYRHELIVAEDGASIPIDSFELCGPPPSESPSLLDEEERAREAEAQACRRHRDRHLPDNVKARRQVVEWRADQDGLFNDVFQPVSDCLGADVASGPEANYCTTFSSEQTSKWEAKASLAANFSLSVNGEGQAGGKLEGSYNGIASGQIEAELKGAFSLDASFDSVFSTTISEEQKRSMTVRYDPSETKVQWYRKAQPRVSYLQLAELDACGDHRREADVFLSDFRASRLILTCEDVGVHEVCDRDIAPTPEATLACADRLIHEDDERAAQCSVDE